MDAFENRIIARIISDYYIKECAVITITIQDIKLRIRRCITLQVETNASSADRRCFNMTGIYCGAHLSWIHADEMLAVHLMSAPALGYTEAVDKALEEHDLDYHRILLIACPYR